MDYKGLISKLSLAEKFSRLKAGLQNIWQQLKSSKRTRVVFLFFLLILALGLGVGKIWQMLKSKSGETGRIEVKEAKAVKDINKEFTFPLKDSKGVEVSKIKYVLEKAELRDEIIVKGQRATAVKGRTFLIITLKVTNEHNQPIEIDTRDYLRLTINANEGELLAPDIHNDPVEVQAISTKYSRVGFPINDSDKKLTLLVGEINGEKQRLALDF